MEKGAERLVNVCAGVRSGERVVIVTDAFRLPIARALSAATIRAGGVPTIVVERGRQIDNQEPDQPVASAMWAADVIFLPVTHALAHTKATRKAIEKGARVVSMSAFTERMMREGGLFADFEARRPLCDHLANRLTRANHVHVTNPAGTDLTFSIADRPGNSHSCLVRSAGFTAVPNIEANTSPVEGTTNGVFVVDGSIPYYEIGPVSPPIHMTMRDGFVVDIQGGSQATFLADLLARQNDRFVYNVAQFAFGLNPSCTTFTGEMLNDEGVNGTIHMGIGTSSNLGGNVQAKTHFDAIISEPTVMLDDEAVLINGGLNVGVD